VAFSALSRDKIIGWPDVYEIGDIILDESKKKKSNEEIIALRLRGYGRQKDVATCYYVYKNAKKESG